MSYGAYIAALEELIQNGETEFKSMNALKDRIKQITGKRPGNSFQRNDPNYKSLLSQFTFKSFIKKAPKTDSLAIASLVLGIVSIVFQPLGLFFGVPAAYLGHRSLHAIAKQPKEIGGHGLAVGGLVTGYIGSVLGAISLVFIVMLVLAIRN